MARELEGKVAVVTGAASGIGLASTEAMLAGGSRVLMVDRDQVALKALCNKHGDAVIPLVIDLLDPKDCATLLPRVLEKAGQLDILHANAGTIADHNMPRQPIAITLTATAWSAPWAGAATPTTTPRRKAS
jgi:ribitol 2-dehydrogenase